MKTLLEAIAYASRICDQSEADMSDGEGREYVE
jgi:hypothetical protein